MINTAVGNVLRSDLAGRLQKKSFVFNQECVGGALISCHPVVRRLTM